ncbi:MAG: hypothetical protein WC889_17535, partial [Myxococcota bacterium]
MKVIDIPAVKNTANRIIGAAAIAAALGLVWVVPVTGGEGALSDRSAVSDGSSRPVAASGFSREYEGMKT